MLYFFSRLQNSALFSHYQDQLITMKKTCFLIYLSLLLLFYSASSQQCLSDSGQPQSDYIQTGVYTIINENYQKQPGVIYSSCYDIPFVFSPPQGKSYSIALSTVQISSQQNLHADFSLRSYKKERSFGIIMVSSLNDWISHSVSYLVSSRDDLLLGNFIVNAFELTGCESSSMQIQGKYAIPNWNKPINSNEAMQTKLFLSGIRTIPTKNVTFISLQIRSVTLNLNSGQISYVLSNKNFNRLLTIEFCYMIIAQTSLKYDLEEISLKGSGVTTKQNFKNSPLYSFGGMLGFSSQKASNNGFGVLAFYELSITCKGSKCLKTCISQKQCSQKQGKITPDPRGNQQCLLECGQNEVFNSSNKCQCIYGFQRKNNICQKMVQKVNCSASEVYNFTINRCQCKDDFILVGTTCLTRCNVNGYMNGSNCTCLVGFRNYNGFCHNCSQVADVVNKKCGCSEPQYYQSLNGSCIKNTCKSNYRFFAAENRCGCLPAQVDLNGKCYDTCGVGKYFVQVSVCTCMPGYTLIKEKGGCFIKANCSKPNETPDQSGYECICKEGFERDEQTQSCMQKCPFNEVLSVDKSSCECQKGLFRDSTSKKCKDNCAQNEIYDRSLQACKCKDGFLRDLSMACVLLNGSTKTCSLNEQYSNALQGCVCIKNYERSLLGICQPIQTKVCPQNSKLQNNDCICDAGFIKMGQSCLSVCGINQTYDQKISLCQCKEGFGKVNNVCRPCPTNTTTKNNACVCLMGLKWNLENNTCEIVCPQNSAKTLITLGNSESVYICQCMSGFIQNSQGQCTKIPDPVCPPIPQNPITCPGTSVWDPTTFKCICNSTAFYFINGTCKACQSNQGWNGNACVCLTGFNMINSKCLKCDINSVYRSGKCNCNFGYYDENPSNIEQTSCKSCHQSCGTCTGPLNSQCLTCLDPEAVLANGKCTSSTNCLKGSFNSTSGCKKCSQYCSKCKDQNQCTECVPGFSIEKVDILGYVSAFCPQICGDGKRFEYECDDGNLKDGDGCDSGCFIEKGWTCNGGSSTSPSVCLKSTNSTRSILSITKPLRMVGQIAQGATLSYIPDALSQNMCVDCNDILMVKLVSYTILPSVQVSYLPTTRFKFLVNFSFIGIYAIPDFVYSIQINPKYEKHFTAEDMAQRIIVPVNPADLALNNPEDQLQIDEVANPFNIF